jgi:hypothetical protein
MGTVVTRASMSLDGSVADPSVGTPRRGAGTSDHAGSNHWAGRVL